MPHKPRIRCIDALWVKYSQGTFGFSVQKRIWESCGSPTKYNRDWEKFGVTVGWRIKGFLGFSSLGVEAQWKKYSKLTFDLSAPTGHLPGWAFWVDGGWLIWSMSMGKGFRVDAFFSRIKTCRFRL